MPSDREFHLEYSDPFQSATERMGSEAGMRRLFQVHFSCPLCGQEHSCEIYLTLVARNEDELMERALETLGRDDIWVVFFIIPFLLPCSRGLTSNLFSGQNNSPGVLTPGLPKKPSPLCTDCYPKYMAMPGLNRFTPRNANPANRSPRG